MTNVGIILIGVALAMDAFAVSIACGMSRKRIGIYKALKVGLFFGGFQALMPLIGYYTWNLLPFDMSTYDHWIAFGLLAFIGGHMIKESFEVYDDEEDKKDLFKTKNLLIAAIATSIDALVAGFSLSILDLGILLLTVTTGIITLMLSMIGVQIGKRFGKILGNRVELISGLVLIGIGIKILIDHLSG